MPTFRQSASESAKRYKEQKEKEAQLASLIEELPAEVVKKLLKKSGYVPIKETQPTDQVLEIIASNRRHPPCPYCNSSHINVHDSNNGLPTRYKCMTCGKTFGAKAGRLVYRSSWTYEMWIEFIQLTMMRKSLSVIKHNFSHKFNVDITEETLLSYRHRLLRALMLYWPMPILEGTVQLDGTFFRESQKGSRELINVAPNVIDERLPRTQWQTVASKYGIAGPEFSCVVVGIDSKEHAVAVVTGLGRNSAEPFETYFSEYLGKIDFLCSDAFPIYDWYCEKHSIPHYVQLSTYRDTVKSIQKEFKEKKHQTITENEIRRLLYGKREIDYLDYYHKSLTFTKFEELKKQYGLGLAKVDHLHRHLKTRINAEMSGVSTKFLQRYVNYLCFIHNWKVDHDGFEPTSEQDAKEIFEALTKACNLYSTADELEGMPIVQMPRVSTRYTTMLARLTDELREKAGKRGLEIDDGDTLIRFNKWLYFRTAPISQLRKVAQTKHIKGYTTMRQERLAKVLYDLPERDTIFKNLIASDGNYSRYSEDIDAIMEKGEAYREEKKREAKNARA